MPLWTQWATTLIALLSFGASVVLVAQRFVLARRANVVVTMERTRERGNLSGRLVFTNFGPHNAREVDFEVRGNDGSPESKLTLVYQDERPFPLPVLHRDETFVQHGAYWTVNGKQPVVTVRWQDGRKRSRSEDYYVSPY